MSHQRRIPLGQAAVLFSGRVIAVVEKLDEGSIPPEKAIAHVVALVHELPLCVKPEDEAKAEGQP